MLLKPFALLFLYFSINSVSAIKCTYIGNECQMTLDNPNGLEFRVENINEPSTGTKSDITSVFSDIRISTNLPKVICEAFYNLVSLRLMNLQIANVDSSRISKCIKLELVDLSGNFLINIHHSTFSQSNNLRAIFIKNCSLIEWHFNWLRNVPNLREIDVRLNNLQTIPANAFHRNAMLSTISISYNNIEELNRASFGNLKFLETVNALNNGMSKIDSAFFENATNLKNAYFQGNLCVDEDIPYFSNDRTGNIGKFKECFQQFSQTPFKFITQGEFTTWRPLNSTIRGIKVSVKAAFDASVILSTLDFTQGDNVEVIFGFNRNNESLIREGNITCTNEVCSENDPSMLLNEKEFRVFRIWWHFDNEILVNNDKSPYPISLTRTKAFDIKSFGVRTSGCNGEWEIDYL